MQTGLGAFRRLLEVVDIGVVGYLLLLLFYPPFVYFSSTFRLLVVYLSLTFLLVLAFPFSP